MKPTILYVDDEPRNLTVFESSLPSDWNIVTFDNPVSALENIDKHNPWVIVSDQRMPGMTGVQFLEIARKLVPKSLRMIVTGYSEEELIVDSVRRARVFDYLRKPWDSDELEACLTKAVDFYRVTAERELLLTTLTEKQNELECKANELIKMTEQLEFARKAEAVLRAELETWVSPFVLWSVTHAKIQFPIRKDVIGIAMDIVSSADIHSVSISGVQLRKIVIQKFTEAVLRNGGWREMHAGDSAYGHFGVFEEFGDPIEAALATAREFRVALRNLSTMNGVNIECGIALHIARNTLLDVHVIQAHTPKGPVTQKSFDTTSTGVDVLHRMEKLVHALPGSNVILTGDFVSKLKTLPANLIELGDYLFPGMAEASRLFLIPSDLVSSQDLMAFRTSVFSQSYEEQGFHGTGLAS